MISRLADRIEHGSDGKKVKIHRYGMWGLNEVIEKRKKDWVVIHPNGKELHFRTLEEAEVYMVELWRGA